LDGLGSESRGASSGQRDVRQPTYGGHRGRKRQLTYSLSPPAGTSSSGGSGGAAGISANGAAGPSIAVAYQGLPLILTRTTTTPGDGGAGVEARSANGKTIPATPAGTAEGVKEL
jgi:hypothetical protein